MHNNNNKKIEEKAYNGRRQKKFVGSLHRQGKR